MVSQVPRGLSHENRPGAKEDLISNSSSTGECLGEPGHYSTQGYSTPGNRFFIYHHRHRLFRILPPTNEHSRRYN